MQNFIINASADVSTIEILGEIGEDWFSEGITMQSINNQLKEIKSPKINLNVSSLGGDVTHALAIYDMIKMHPAKVNTKIIGATASAGTIIALAGDNIEMSENSLFLIHNAWTLSMGNSEDLRKTASDLDQFDNRLVNIYQKKTGQTKSYIRDLMAEERWIDAKEAKKLGFVDSIFKPLKAAASISKEKQLDILNKLKETKTMNLETLKEFKDEILSEIKNLFGKENQPEDFEKTVNDKLAGFEAKIVEQEDYKAQVTDLSENLATITSEKEQIQASFDELKAKSEKLESDFNALKAEKTDLKQDEDPELGEEPKATALGQEILGSLSDVQKFKLKNLKK